MKQNDIDITTSATPSEVAKLFKTYPTGLKFGSVTIKYKGRTYEVTTFREDFNYKDFRRPSEIKYAKTAQEDVQRRDFTINALLINENKEIIDYVGGRKDLKKKIIRAVGDPYKRFKEDALRMFRAFYFQAKLGFDIEKNTYRAISEYADNAKNIASERILLELRKMVNQKHLPLALKSIYNSKIINFLSPFKEFIKFQIENDIYFYKNDFFTIAYYFNPSITDMFIFPNNDLKRFELFKELLDKKTKITNYLLYKYGLNIVLEYNKFAKVFVKENHLDRKVITKMDNNLVAKNRKEIPLTNVEIMKILKKPGGPWLKNLEEKLVIGVLENKIRNNKEDLIKYIKEESNE